MSGTTLAAIKVGPSTTEIRELNLPDIPPDAALLKVEIAGVCGTDVSQYPKPLRGAPLIMGHENVGHLAKVGRDFERHKGFKDGDLVFLEHYLPCGHCEWDHMGEYRHCAATEWFYDPTAIRYGYTSMDIAPGLWGGFSQYLYLPLNAVLHRIPEGLTPELAGVATPMSNGIQWTLMDGGVGYASTVLIQGPGQQGLCCVMAARQAGAAQIIITGMAHDARRLEVARALGADVTIDVEHEDPLARVMDVTGGRGVDVVVDCTVGAGPKPMLLGIEATKRRGGTMVVQGEGNQEFPNFPIGRLTRKGITLKSARGHSYRAVELALYHLAAKRFPLELMTTHRFGLKDVDYAIKSVGGKGAAGAIHVSVLPWGVVVPDTDVKSTLAQSIRMLTRAEIMDYSGHASVRRTDESFYINSGASVRATLTAADIVAIDLDGAVLEGTARPPLEFHIHAAIYRARSDVAVVIHTHPKWSTYLTMTGVPYQPVFGQGVLLGAVPVLDNPLSVNTRPAGERLVEALGDGRAVLLQSHGAVITGADLVECFALAVYLEENAERQYMARQIGTPHVFTEAEQEVCRRNLWSPSLFRKAWDHYAAKL